jgi:hypothetical protein
MNTIRDILKKHLICGIFMGMLAILLFRAGGIAIVSATDIWVVGTNVNYGGRQSPCTTRASWFPARLDRKRDKERATLY